MIRALVEQKRIVVCVGPGGVGKTTTAAALGALAARLGRKTLVCTIDPAPRLADALGVGGLGPEPRPVPAEACRALGIPEEGAGRLFAVRLDTARAFARLVDEQVADPGDAAADLRQRDLPPDHHLAHRVAGVRGDAGALRAGARGELRSHRARHAAHGQRARLPGRAQADRGGRLQPGAQLVRPPARGERTKRLSFRRLRAGGALVLRRLAKLVGSRFLDDVGAFLIDFQQVLGGFLARAKAVDQLAARPGRRRSCWCWCRRWPPSTRRSTSTAGCARPASRSAAFIANRVQPAPGLTDAGALAAALRATPAFADLPDAALDRGGGAAGSARRAPSRRCTRGSGGRSRGWRRSAPGTEITEIPLLDHDVDNLAELRVVGEALLAG